MIKNKRKKAGYSLTEILIVLVIMALIASVSIPAVNNYQKASILNANNDKAQTVFLTLSNELSKLKLDDRLDEFKDAIKHSGNNQAGSLDHYMGKLKNDKGNYITYNNIYADGKANELYYLIASGRDWEKYTQNKNNNKAISYLYDLLVNYSVNDYDDFYNASICVEIDLTAGQVYSAFYCQPEYSLSYGGNLADRSFKGRQKHKTSANKADLVGYYGVEKLYCGN